jgi:hypothetical protein
MTSTSRDKFPQAGPLISGKPVHILVAATGSVAAMNLPILICELREKAKVISDDCKL